MCGDQAEYLRGAAGLCAAGAEGTAAQVHQEQEGSHTQHHHVRQGDMRRSEAALWNRNRKNRNLWT
jgi:hypothetical protein